MPILDKRKNQFIEDQDTRVSVGIDFPFARVPNQDGYFKTTKTTIDSIKNNNVVSLISDAGTPVISDPGTILVNKCINEYLKIYPIPGSSAVTSAVSVSGFNDQYLFYGFLTKKENELENVLKNLIISYFD